MTSAPRLTRGGLASQRTGMERRHYHSAVSDTARWDHFTSRPGDVFVCTPAKCGTTARHGSPKAGARSHAEPRSRL